MSTRHPLILFLCAAVVCHGEETVRSTQEELRRRNIYFGDIDGSRSSEYSDAVRQYQRRKGLSVSGTEDRNTLKSLGLVTRAPDEPLPKELSWPEEPILKSDTTIDVATEANEIAEDSGVAAAPLDPIAASRSQHQRRSAASRQSPKKPAKNEPEDASLAPRFSLRDPAAIGKDIAKFVGDYLHAVGRNELSDELHFYADRVDYFGQRQIDRRIVEQTLRRYYQKWPKRSYKLTGPLKYQTVPQRAQIVIVYRTEFSLKGGKQHVRGLTETQITINAATSDPRIVAIEERRVRQ